MKIKTLAALYGRYFDSSLRQRGENYFKRGAVKQIDAQSGKVQAKVRGSSWYHVELNVTAAECECSCPYFESVGPCKHIWAVVLAVDVSGHREVALDVPLTAAMLQSVAAQIPGAESIEMATPYGVIKLGEYARSNDTRGADGVAARKKPPAVPAWKRQVDDVLQSIKDHETTERFVRDRDDSQRLSEGAKLEYVLDLDYFGDGSQLLIRTNIRKPSKRGDGFLAPKPFRLHPDHLPHMSDEDRPIGLALMGAASQWSYRHDARDAHTLFAQQQEILLPMMARTGRCFYRKDRQLFPLPLDEGQPWQFTLDIRQAGSVYRLDASLRRGDQTRPPSEPIAILRTGWLIWEEGLSRFDGREHFPWMQHFRNGEAWISVPTTHGPQLLEHILSAARLPKINVPPELQFEEVAPPCLPGVVITDPRADRLMVQLVFDYDGLRVPEGKPGAGMFQLTKKRWVRRDGSAEAAAVQKLTELRTRNDYNGLRSITPGRLPGLVRELVGLGWRVEAQGKVYRRGGTMSVSVSSGIDWLEVQGRADFDGADASLPEVLAALRKGESFVRLSDGSFGLLPEEWLEQYGLLAKTGQTKGDLVTFKPTQAMLLDAMLAELPGVRLDEAFVRARDRLEACGRIAPAMPPEGFVGELRHYQQDGLGWLNFLRGMEFGGCLADDMGLGKTIQVLALLESRRVLRGAGVSPACLAGILPAPGEVDLTSHSAQANGTHNAGETPAPRGEGVSPSCLAGILPASGEVGLASSSDQANGTHNAGETPASRGEGVSPSCLAGILPASGEDGLTSSSDQANGTHNAGGTPASRGAGVSPSCLAGILPASGEDGLTSSSDQANGTHNAGETPAPRGPSLAVVPRSLIFNWMQEARRFTPQLRVLDHSGAARGETFGHFRDYDLILTTYGTMRSDIELLKDVEFDYVILDEAQAIKNAQTASAKASRLLNGRHRLCLSGTPIENHLGELWSQMEFLNPGLLGSWAGFGDGKGISDIDRQRLARALRPFILRRTKEQVATELPSCTEQTVYCQLKGPQRDLYNQLRDHYRSSLRTQIESAGLAKSKMQILEALLRLRQAACHGGLIDKTQADGPSAKTDALIAQLQEVTDGGHKALVFSQFTSLLALVKPQLDALRLPYEYLDGRTRDRQAKVERFQNDPDCPIFLISLKAGGLGLNLTAAEYVFLLDPWWNPAVESQAIDRAHRIGQTKPVFAYRLIAQDTIEEKVLQLQQTKRDLADSIITADNSVIRDLTRDDLDMLLG